MKYLIVLGDGMADKNIPELDNRTPLDYADTPAMDKYSKLSEIGMVRTVPEGMAPGSDTANLSVLGYNPREYYTGRSPLEALSIGVDMKPTDVALRCNIVTVSTDDLPYEEKTIIDHSSSEISTEDAAVLLEAVRKELETDIYKFYVGTSYRHLTIWDKGEVVELTPPHDVLGQVIGQYLPKTEALREMMKKSYDILSNHPINVERMKKGLNPANSIWLWGEGTRPGVTGFEAAYGVKASVISAVDLIKGIGLCAGMKVIEVEGATGNIDTNFKGKGEAALKTLLDGQDLVYIHVEAPDECGHHGDLEGKIQAIERIDQDIVGPLLKGLEEAGEDYSILVMPDHPTPISIKTHISDPIPYLLYCSTDVTDSGIDTYTEKTGESTGVYVEPGYLLMQQLLKNK